MSIFEECGAFNNAMHNTNDLPVYLKKNQNEHVFSAVKVKETEQFLPSGHMT